MSTTEDHPDQKRGSPGAERSPMTPPEPETAERARILAALEESERRYRTLVSQIRDYAIFGMDDQGRATTWNEGVEAVLGYGQEEFIGSPVELAFLPEDIAAGIPQRELETARREGVANDDRWLRRKNGSRFFAVGRTTPQLDAGGRVIGFSKIFRDETRRVMAEAAHRVEAIRLRTLVRNLRDYAIFMLDPSGRITEWSEGAELISGYRTEEVFGKHFEIFYTPQDRAAHAPQQELAEAGERGRVEREGWRITRHGQYIWINEICTALYDSAGVLTGFTKISRDLTQRKRAEDALRETDRKKDEFLATLAHELRNPLSPLRNGLAIMRLGCEPGSGWNDTLEMMNRQLTHLVRLVDDLLDVARISTGKVELRMAVVSLREVLAASVEATHAAVKAHAHRLSIQPYPRELFVAGDFDRLAQVFSNLISNSAKYMEPHGEIRVSVSTIDTAVEVTVSDNGIGIPQADLPHVFEMFSQISSHRGRAQGGLGIGLSLVKNLVELHKGQVQAHSAGPGKGSDFIVRLPLASAPVASDFERSGADDSSGPPRRILVVDDNQDAARSLAILLRLGGHEVALAYDGWQAIEQVKGFAPQMVLMDLGMPGLDGIEAAKQIRALPQGDRLILIALTGWGQARDRSQTQQAGFDRHLVKPLDTADLEALLRQMRARLDEMHSSRSPAQ